MSIQPPQLTSNAGTKHRHQSQLCPHGSPRWVVYRSSAGQHPGIAGECSAPGMSPHTSLQKEGTPRTGHTTAKELSSPSYKSRLLVSATRMRVSPSAEQLLPWLGKEMRPVVLVCHPPGLREAYSHTSWS